MHFSTYLLAWLLAVLAAIGALSWALTRYTRRHDLRRLQAEQLVAALQRYAAWVATQRLAAVFQGEPPDAAEALDRACMIRMAWFPELAGDMAEVLAVHNRLINFLANQQALWLRNPERWLESEHDKRFMALWRQHRYALQALLGKLEHATRVQIALPPVQHESTYA